MSKIRVEHRDVAEKLAVSKLHKNYFGPKLEKTIYVFRRMSRELSQGTPEQLAGIVAERFEEYCGFLLRKQI